MTNSTFSGNAAAKFSGGGIANTGTVTVTNSTFQITPPPPAASPALER